MVHSDSYSIFSKFSQLPNNLKIEVDAFINKLLSKEKKAKRRPKFGSAKGMIKMKRNFDAPIDGFQDYQ